MKGCERTFYGGMNKGRNKIRFKTRHPARYSKHIRPKLPANRRTTRQAKCEPQQQRPRDADRDDYCGTASGAILMVSTHGSGLTP